MKRLTVLRDDGRWALANDDNAYPMDQIMKLPRAIDRLAEYENTGLTPDEIMRYFDDRVMDLSDDEIQKRDGEPVYLSNGVEGSYKIVAVDPEQIKYSSAVLEDSLSHYNLFDS